MSVKRAVMLGGQAVRLPGATLSVPASIDATGTNDVTADLFAWIDALPPYSTADLAGGTFRSETYLLFEDKVGLTIQNGTLLRTDAATHGGIVYPDPNPHLWMLRTRNCHVKNLTVLGTNTVADQRDGFGSYLVDWEFEAAVRFHAFQSCSVVGLACDGIWGDGVQWQVGIDGYTADSVIDRIGRQGISIIGTNMLVDNVRIEHGRRGGIDIEPDLGTHDVRFVEIRNCYMNTIGLPIPSQGRGPITDVYIHDNVSEGPSVPVLYCRAADGARRARYRIENHTALTELGSSAPAVFLTGVEDPIVHNCTLPVSTGQSRLLVGMDGCSGTITITNNTGSPGGDLYYNINPVAGQTLVITGNTPALSERVRILGSEVTETNTAHTGTFTVT